MTATPDTESLFRAHRFAAVRRWRKFVEQDIWEFGVSGEPSLKGQWVAILRILSISWRGLLENGLFGKAASLSYSSLIALGPLVAIIAILSASFVQTDAETQIKRALLFISPSLQQMLTLEGGQSAPATEAQEKMASALDSLITQIVDGAENLLSQVNTSGSKAFGALGSLILIWVVIQLLTSVETTLNQIWGVHKGRAWSQRIVFYWTFVSLGALLGLSSTALLSASNLAAMTDWVPFGSNVLSWALSFSPLLSFVMLVMLLALFYRFFPNTSVSFRAAVAGSLLTTTLLFINNYLGVLYVHRVITFQSFYGSVGIIPVLMLGLYFFWVLILLGGQLTYAVQNVSLLTNQAAWRRICPLARELVTLGVFLQIARRFHACEPAPTISQISARLHVPVNILNESLETLREVGWIASVTLQERQADNKEIGFRPAKPLEAYTLARFRNAVEGAGQSGLMGGLRHSDPLLGEYAEALRAYESDALCKLDLRTLLSRGEAAPAQP